MSEDTAITTTIFEGIASVDVEGVAHDAYMTAQVEIVGEVMIRWHGTLGWMGKEPNLVKNEALGALLDMSFSDGREGIIQIHHLSAEDDGKLEFQGHKLPPGFEPMYTKAVIPPDYLVPELRSTTLPRWRVWSGRLLAVAAFVLMVAGVWVSDYRGQYLVTGLITSLVSIQMVTPAKGRQLKEIPHADSP